MAVPCGILLGQDSASGTTSVSVSGAAQAPGQFASHVIDTVGSPNRVKPGDYVFVVISASAADTAKTFSVTSTGTTWTRVVQHTLTERRIEVWLCDTLYDGTADGWASWSKLPSVTASGGTGSQFRAATMAARGLTVQGPGLGQPSWEGTWTATTTPTYPATTMPTETGTSITVALVTGRGSGSPFLDVANGWSETSSAFIDPSGVQTLNETYHLWRTGAGRMVAPAPGLESGNKSGNVWGWIGYTATGVPFRRRGPKLGLGY